MFQLFSYIFPVTVIADIVLTVQVLSYYNVLVTVTLN